MKRGGLAESSLAAAQQALHEGRLNWLVANCARQDVPVRLSQMALLRGPSKKRQLVGIYVPWVLTKVQASCFT